MFKAWFRTAIRKDDECGLGTKDVAETGALAVAVVGCSDDPMETPISLA